MGLNTVFVHARSHGDAYYKSDLYPWSKYVTGTIGNTPDYDPFAIMVEQAHAYGLSIHAWINPLRLCSDSEIGSVSAKYAVGSWYQNSSTRGKYVVKVGSYWYLNPAYEEVTDLIAAGAAEIVAKYNVDGLHIDDYFYPTTDENFDKENYLSYKNSVSYPLPLDDYRRTAVSQFVSAVYRIVKGKDDNLKFGISPQADIQKNRNNLYADIEKWCADDGYIDYIMPQIYFGFECPLDDFKFENCLENWLSIPRFNTEIYVGLGLYRSGEIVEYGGKKSYEWVENRDIIARQILHLRENNISGFSIFSYSSFEKFKVESENICNLLKGTD